jgi:1-acyl-sn-glycerol-3-phosphate acyltransferase
MILDHLLSVPLFTGLRWVGIIIGVVSTFFLALAIIQFTRAAGGLPVSAFPPKKIIRTGIFSAYRHPIYLFYAALFCAAALVWGSWSMSLIVMPLFVAGVGIYILAEEKDLRRRFGRDYEAYQEQAGIIFPKFHVLLKLPFFFLSRRYFPIRVENQQNIPDQAPFFIVANHRNYLDPFLIAYTLSYKVHYITTYEMFRKKLRAIFFRSLGCIPKKRYLPDDGSVREIIRALKKGSVIGIFPEGERSYTGELQEFKPEPMKLFARFCDVPVVPVAISGNFLLWPRWGRGWRRTDITITYKAPIWAGKNETLSVLAGRIKAAIRPDDSGMKCRHDRRAHDIQEILYRCPACRQFDGMKPEGNDIVCAECGKRFHLAEDYRIEGASIREFYDRIRITYADLAHSDPESPIARSGACAFWKEKGRELEEMFSGTAHLYGDRLVLREDGGKRREVALRLKDLRSATIEGVDRLQCHDGERQEMYRIVLQEDSARKWQDYIAEACRGTGNTHVILR